MAFIHLFIHGFYTYIHFWLSNLYSFMAFHTYIHSWLFILIFIHGFHTYIHSWFLYLYSFVVCILIFIHGFHTYIHSWLSYLYSINPVNHRFFSFLRNPENVNMNSRSKYILQDSKDKK